MRKRASVLGRNRSLRQRRGDREAAVEADVDAFLRRERGCAGLRDPLADSSPLSARHRSPRRLGRSVRSRDRAEVDALIGSERADAQDFEALEQALRHQALGIAAEAMAQRFNADDSDHSGSTIACACGRTARYRPPPEGLHHRCWGR